ncbi:MAG TPA: type ISP restriction/modification enzyme [Leptolyngbyaceae cyanobacterium]
MSKILVSQYQAEIEKIIQSAENHQADSIRFAFQELLSKYCKARDFQLIPALDYKITNGKIIYPDGTIKDPLRLDWGYWESKKRDDNNLDREIENKLSQGYPNSNILFQDPQTVVLIQGGTEVMRVSIKDGEAVDKVLAHFINYARPEVKDFRAAIEIFKQDLPTILDTLRDKSDRQYETNPEFRNRLNKFWQICQNSINPNLTLLDIREIMIQHILTEDIFFNIFKNSPSHQENNITRELQQVIDIFYSNNTKTILLNTVESYYAVIRKAAAHIYKHQEKQKFLKAVYENFYKAYNPKAADRLGIVYTPHEIVRFMIESVDDLLYNNFDKQLAGHNVEILDPATGTGTFITELIEYLPKNCLQYKYKNEIHCNEVAILPYYIANLNIEFTYQQKMGEYEKFENVCLVDTLENTGFESKPNNLFQLKIENAERIKRQSARTISVIIGNPPYNANQLNENENNQNIKYPAIDQRIQDTYIKNSKAQKTKLYDMYARFLRWASDRLGKNGIIAFVSNNSFIDARTYDGFRKVITEEFNEIYIINLKGNARTSSERRRREGGNVFNNTIRVGIAVYFLIRKENAQGCRIYYNAVPDYTSADEKKSYLSSNKFQELQFEQLIPDRNNNWLDLVDNNFDSLLPIANKVTKSKKDEQAVFKLFSLGVITARDEWVYDTSAENLKCKVKYLIDTYNQDVDNQVTKNYSSCQPLAFNPSIKWSRAIKKDLLKCRKYSFSVNYIRDSLYRPFAKQNLYFSKHLNEMQYQLGQIFINNVTQNLLISFSEPGSLKPFMVLATNKIPDYHLVGDSQCLPLYRYDKEGNRIDNITDWGLAQFQNHYRDVVYNVSIITKLDIFYYTYAVLHYPTYRQKYELNLKREFPRLPFYDNFNQWVSWGKQLMELHINYETIAPYPLKRIDLPLDESRDAKFRVFMPKVKLKAEPDKSKIILDTVTMLEGVPKVAWEYQLGDRSALEWILDRYKEKKPKDSTIAERFNTYRFAGYKEQAIDLLQRICTVSVETMRIIGEMEG